MMPFNDAFRKMNNEDRSVYRNIGMVSKSIIIILVSHNKILFTYYNIINNNHNRKSIAMYRNTSFKFDNFIIKIKFKTIIQ